jgi:hypothetical protein
MERLLRTLPPALRGMGFGDPDDVEYAHALDVVAWALREIDRLREERRWVPVVGEIVDMQFSTEIGVYYGTIRCPKCDQDVSVSPMADRPTCRCGVQWDFSVSAVGEQPLPPGPEGDG